MQKRTCNPFNITTTACGDPLKKERIKQLKLCHSDQNASATAQDEFNTFEQNYKKQAAWCAAGGKGVRPQKVGEAELKSGQAKAAAAAAAPAAAATAPAAAAAAKPTPPPAAAAQQQQQNQRPHQQPPQQQQQQNQRPHQQPPQPPQQQQLKKTKKGKNALIMMIVYPTYVM